MLPMFLQTLGALIAGVVLAQVGYGLYSFIRQRRRSLQLLELRIDQATETARTEQLLNRQRIEQTELSWDGYRKFEVQRKVCEDRNGNVCSFYLVPHDDRPLPAFQAGQFLTFQFDIGSQLRQSLQGFVVDPLRRQDDLVVRCYSLSDAPNPDHYRVTIKRLRPPSDNPDAPAGIASTFLHQHIQEGDILNVKAPSGTFCIDLNQPRPVVLIGGGIGITPMLSMLNTLVGHGDKRETWIFYGVHNCDDQIQRDHLEVIAREHANVRLQLCFSDPKPMEILGTDYHHGEHVSVNLLRRLLPSNNYEFYICGPPPMMAALFEGLSDWGVPETDIKYEAFGPATVKKARPSVAAISAIPADGLTVTFAKSGKVCRWTSDVPFLLELAEANGVAIDFGCRVGNCNTCLTAIREGEVTYVRHPDTMPEKGSCLTCIAMPKTNVVLDA